jgi:hypothetical protein
VSYNTQTAFCQHNSSGGGICPRHRRRIFNVYVVLYAWAGTPASRWLKNAESERFSHSQVTVRRVRGEVILGRFHSSYDLSRSLHVLRKIEMRRLRRWFDDVAILTTLFNESHGPKKNLRRIVGQQSDRRPRPPITAKRYSLEQSLPPGAN